MTTGPQDPARAGRDQFRAGHADRERVIVTLKDAYVHGRLTKDEFDARTSRALIARTYADLALLTADIPPAQVAARPAHPPVPAHRRPLARATAQAISCLVLMTAAWWVASLADPGATTTSYGAIATPLRLVAFFAGLTALCVFGSGLAASLEQRRSRGAR